MMKYTQAPNVNPTAPASNGGKFRRVPATANPAAAPSTGSAGRKSPVPYMPPRKSFKKKQGTPPTTPRPPFTPSGNTQRKSPMWRGA